MLRREAATSPKPYRRLEAVPPHIVTDPEALYDLETLEFNWDDEDQDDDDAYETEAQRRGYVPFDPTNELKKIKSFSTTEKKMSRADRQRIKVARLAEYKKNLEIQTNGIAKLIEDLFNHTKAQPDTTLAEFKTIVLAAASQYRLTTNQLAKFRSVLTKYCERHQTLVEFRQRYRDVNELFHACFGVKPKGKVEVIAGAMTIHFRCFNDDDYNIICHYGYKASNIENLPSFDDSAGIAKPRVALPELNFMVTAGRMSAQLDSQAVFDHEEAHQFNTLFVDVWNAPLRDNVIIKKMTQSMGERPEEALEKIIDLLVREKRKTIGIDERARDEILAFYREGTNIKHIQESLLNYHGYDYAKQFSNEIDAIPQTVQDLLMENLSDVTYKEKPQRAATRARLITSAVNVVVDSERIQQTIERVFGEEYKKDIGYWLKAIQILEEKNYTRGRILGLLQTKPVHEWMSLARRSTPNEA